MRRPSTLLSRWASCRCCRPCERPRMTPSWLLTVRPAATRSRTVLAGRPCMSRACLRGASWPCDKFAHRAATYLAVDQFGLQHRYKPAKWRQEQPRRKTTMPDAEQTKASYGRWYILGVICLMYLITYLDRVNISTAAPEIRKEFGFDLVTMGWIFSAFGWSYALFQVPGGWLSDRFGARSVLTGIVTYWSVMTAAIAASTGWVSFVIFRFLFGIGEAGAFPGATRAMQLWYTPQERGFVQGLTHSASRLGAAIAPPFVVLIMTALGWRSVFYICGAIGVVWALWWYLSYRNLPEEHGMVNREELAHIRGLNAFFFNDPAATEREA